VFRRNDDDSRSTWVEYSELFHLETKTPAVPDPQIGGTLIEDFPPEVNTIDIVDAVFNGGPSVYTVSITDHPTALDLAATQSLAQRRPESLLDRWVWLRCPDSGAGKEAEPKGSIAAGTEAAAVGPLPTGVWVRGRVMTRVGDAFLITLSGRRVELVDIASGALPIHGARVEVVLRDRDGQFVYSGAALAALGTATRQCAVCMEHVNKSAFGQQRRGCTHESNVCESCTKAHVLHSLANGNKGISCPTAECENEIRLDEIERIAGAEAKRAFLKRLAELEMAAQENQLEDPDFLKFAIAAGLRRCPHCAACIEKNGGCNNAGAARAHFDGVRPLRLWRHSLPRQEAR